ncbi:maleylpyruvate isomerase family mycothiol-dependent enzyme [Micromonospora fluostatini]|uniref:maleylpyruvate isomerase family mycothiol-dependent enzyme n=1 Tax=Micromonospora sp. JCM 30529 TaxID=3421643 RepID=UPI003D17F0CA
MPDLVLTERRGLTVGPELIGEEVRRQRSNLLRLLATLNPQDWAAPTRCPDWSVHDLLRHMLNVTEFHVCHLSGDPELERFTRHGPFRPAITPALWLKDSPEQTPEATVEAWTQIVAEEQRHFAARAAEPDGPLTTGPSTRQLHWSTLSLHVLWDNWIHERDVALALGREPESRAEDFPLVTMYGLLIAGGVATVTGHPPAVTLELGDDATTRYEIGVDDDDVFVAAGATGDPHGSGSTTEVLDSLSGRGPELAEALRAPASVVAPLGTLRLVM